MTEERLAEQRLSRTRFIRLGAALGVGAAGASMIAACGGESGGGGGAGGGATQAPGETEGGQQGGGAGGDAIAGEADVPPGSAVQFTESGQPAVLVRLENGDFAAYSAICTHQQCTVAYENQSGQLACPCHGSVYDPANGAAVVSGPAPRPLSGIPVEVRDGQVVRA